MPVHAADGRAAHHFLAALHDGGGGADVWAHRRLLQHAAGQRGLLHRAGLPAGGVCRLAGVAAVFLCPVCPGMAGGGGAEGCAVRAYAGGGVRRRVFLPVLAGEPPGGPPRRHGLPAQGAVEPHPDCPDLLLPEQPQLYQQRHSLHQHGADGDLQHPHPGGSGGGGHAVRLPRPAVRIPYAAGAGRHPEHFAEPVQPIPPVPREHRHHQPQVPRPEASDRGPPG